MIEANEDYCLPVTPDGRAEFPETKNVVDINTEIEKNQRSDI